MNSIYLLAQDALEQPFYMNQTLWVLGGMVAAIICSYLIGKVVSKSLRSEDHGWKIATILGAVLCAAILVSVLPLKFGVDLRGGYTIIGELNEQEVDDKASRLEVKEIIPRLLERIDPSGTKEITIRALGTDRLEVIIPDVKKEEAERIWERLTQTGQLLFRIVAKRGDGMHSRLVAEADTMLREGNPDEFVRDSSKEGNPIIGRWYKIARIREEGQRVNAKSPYKFIPLRNNIVRSSLTLQEVDMNQVHNVLLSEINMESPNADRLAGGKLAAYANMMGYGDLEVLMVEPPDEDDPYNVEGKHLASVKESRDERGGLALAFTMNKEGTRRMMRLTTKNRPVDTNKQYLGIVLEGLLHTAPSINGTISTNGIIEGRFTKAEIEDLKTTLNSGKIDVTMNKNPISQDYVNSALGKELRDKGIWAIGVSFVLVIIFMLVYYRFAGIIACIALLMNLLFLAAIVMFIKQPLTLTGLAGIVLTVGMSVDANVLIFERIREELNRGASLRMAIRNGFDRATTTIVDANLTTLITALVLYVIGTEQIKGFSITLIVGILMSMFTAIFCARVAFELGERRGFITKLGMMQLMTKSNWDFIGKRGFAAVVSAIVIIIGLAATVYRGSGILDHDLRGGSTARVVFIEDSGETVESIREKLAANGYVNPLNGEKIEYSVSRLTGEGESAAKMLRVKIDSNLPIQEKEPEDKAKRVKKLEEILVEVFGDKLQHLSVEFDPASIKIEKVNAAGKLISSEPGENKSGKLNLKDRLFLESINFSSMSALTYLPQEKGGQDKSKNEAGKNEADKKDQGKQGSGEKKQDSKVGNGKNQDADKKTDGKSGDPKTGEQSKKGDAKKSGDNSKTGANNQGGGNFSPGQQRFKATGQLDYQFSISRSGVISALAGTAKKHGIRLSERDITAKPLDIGEKIDDGSDKFQAKSWEVSMNRLLDQNDAAKLLGIYKTELSSKPYFPTIGGVGGQIARQTQIQAFVAIIASLIGIIAYVWIRFQNVAFGLAAVVALVHDVLVVLGSIAVSVFLADFLGFAKIDNFKISLPVVAAFLTIIGYSLNDTIVVFDRIREVRGKRTELTSEMINESICQTLSRTILTSLTTFIVVFILFVAGGQAIHGFAFALVVGVIVGTYSSIFVASPVLLFLMRNQGRQPDSEKAVA